MKKQLVLILVPLVVTASAETAAAYCDSFTADAGANDIVVGELYNYLPPPIDGYVATGDAVICWENSSGAVRTEYISCDDSTSGSSSDRLYIDAAAGDDRVAVWTGGLRECNLIDPPYSVVFGPFDFDFGLRVDLGDGDDEFYGSDNNDFVYSNYSSTAADGDFDIMCGFDGADFLLGDTSDSASDREWMIGGNGEDWCYGYGASSPERDLSSSCEWTNSTATGILACGHPPEYEFPFPDVD